MVPILFSLFQRLQYDDPESLAPYRPIRCGIEGARNRVGRSNADIDQPFIYRKQGQVQPAGYSHVTIASNQSFDRMMHSSQRCRAGGINQMAAAGEIQQVGHPTGYD
ncbi:hypothetical protein D1872_250040 [compost metagenome]